jgi:uncharacterized membrane protein YfcA
MLARGELPPEDAPRVGRLKNLVSILVLIGAVSGGAWLSGATPAELIALGLLALVVVAGVWMLSKRRRTHDGADSLTPQ